MNSMMTMAERDAGGWQKTSPSTAKSIESAVAPIQEGFSLKDGATASEKASWSRVDGMGLESDGAIERLKASEKKDNKAYDFIENSKTKRPHYRDVHLEEVWNNPELTEGMRDPSKVFESTFKDCKAEPVYRMNTTRSLHRCEEGIPTTHHTCVRYLKSSKIVERRKDYRFADLHGGGALGGSQWQLYNMGQANNGTVFGHPGIYDFLRGGHRGETPFPSYGESPSLIPEGLYSSHSSWAGAGYIRVYQHYYYYKRSTRLDLITGERVEEPWRNVSREEYEAEDLEVEDVWVSTCDELDKRVDEGICRKIEPPLCLSESGSREIGENKITRDCFQQEYTYVCSTGVVDTCAPLRAKGCIQRGSRCLQEMGPECVHFEAELECMEQVKEPTGETKLVCGGAPYCMNGNCREETLDPNSGPNKDLMEVMTKLKVLSEASKYMDGGSLQIFTGSRLQCKKDMMNFRDCCNGGGGWGKSMNLGGCGGEEQTLALQRSKGLCVEVGTYCAHKEKITKMCLSKKTSFCCFPNKLLKLIQEQGRRQLRLGWGEPKETDCRGLTADELSKVDFSKLNLREVEEEMMTSFNASFPSGKIDDALKERLTQMQSSLQGGRIDGIGSQQRYSRASDAQVINDVINDGINESMSAAGVGAGEFKIPGIGSSACGTSSGTDRSDLGESHD